ncbi:Shikimate kinase/Threonine synthase-like 1 [Macleaya cordata]|uniref:Gluconokinase n=1 Tax=Macleaya cordata TaxID=56857 RepID=A0A200QNR1_MACCD|nr:Shikimate kinase/Threonine synthase-like 1 [Macleaya cordata]
MLAKKMECNFLDADNFHPQANIEKMSKGIPLTEEDRIPWLETLRDTLRNKMNLIKSMSSNIDTGNDKKKPEVILCCSALQKSYREILRTADPNYKPGSYIAGRVRFVCLEAPMEVIESRVKRRGEEGNHFMPASLLQSQFDLLQIDPAEKDITVVDATHSPQVIVNNIQASVFGSLNFISSLEN